MECCLSCRFNLLCITFFSTGTSFSSASHRMNYEELSSIKASSQLCKDQLNPSLQLSDQSPVHAISLCQQADIFPADILFISCMNFIATTLYLVTMQMPKQSTLPKPRPALYNWNNACPKRHHCNLCG
jgi:hypothetical protein